MGSSLFSDCFGLQRKGRRRKMPCTNCMAEYTRRRKEIGCARCGFGFCERCASMKIAMPSVSANKPVPVCSACYALLTNPTQHCQQRSLRTEKSRDLPPLGQPLPQQNAWGADGGQLPPPSLRSLYNAKSTGKNGFGGDGGGEQQRRADQWNDLEARLARLNDPNQFGEPAAETPTGTLDRGQNRRPNNARPPAPPPPIEELEERLAALRGVPVEVIRKPRLMVINDSDDEHFAASSKEMPLSDEAAQLLRQVECGYPGSLSDNKNGRNIAANVKQQTDGGDDQCSINSECPSSVLQNVISDALRAPSPSNLSSGTVSDAGQLYPNFAECVRKTVEDAKAAEREAIAFIQKHEHQQIHGGQQQPKDRKGSGK